VSLHHQQAFRIPCALLLTGIVACQPSEKPLRIAVAIFSHETGTFCPGGDVTIEDWTRSRAPLKGDELLESGGYIGGFVSLSREYGKVRLIGLTHVGVPPNGARVRLRCSRKHVPRPRVTLGA
jgi:hypothetical protein